MKLNSLYVSFSYIKRNAYTESQNYNGEKFIELLIKRADVERIENIIA